MSATDPILDIVSGRIASSKVSQVSETVAKAAPEASKGPREVGRTVSSEISRAQMSAMSAAGAATVNRASDAAAATALDFKPIEASVENAEVWVGRLTLTISNDNRQFDLQEIPSREEHMAGKEVYMARVVASGASQKIIDNTERGRYGEGGYERTVSWINEDNAQAFRAADWTESSIVNFKMLLSQTFGKEVSVNKDDAGRLTLGALDSFYGNGQKKW